MAVVQACWVYKKRFKRRFSYNYCNESVGLRSIADVNAVLVTEVNDGEHLVHRAAKTPTLLNLSQEEMLKPSHQAPLHT